jgi:hypothetical protein
LSSISRKNVVYSIEQPLLDKGKRVFDFAIAFISVVKNDIWHWHLLFILLKPFNDTSYEVHLNNIHDSTDLLFRPLLWKKAG